LIASNEDNKVKQVRQFTRNLEQIRIAAARLPRLTPPLDVRERAVRILVPPEADPAVRYIPCDLVEKDQIC
jgi:hypothetical protein